MAILLIKLENVVIKVENPAPLDMISSDIMKGIDNVILLVPFLSDMRVYSIKG